MDASLIVVNIVVDGASVSRQAESVCRRQSHYYQTDEKTVALLLPLLKIDISPS